MNSTYAQDPTPPDVRVDQVEVRSLTAGQVRQPDVAPGRTQVATAREVEAKLRVEPDFELPNLHDLPGIAEVREEPLRQMLAVYHDTETLALFRWRVTLRRREGGGDAGWHLKLPVEGMTEGARDELALPLSAGEVGEVPEELADIVSAFVRGAPLVPVVTLATHRKPYTLLDEAGNPIAELVDDVVTVLAGNEEVDTFREIEIEAIDSSAELVELAQVFLDAGATTSTTSKAAAAMGAAATAPADVPEPGPLTRGDTAAEVIQAFIQLQVRALLLQDVRVRRHLPDSVHQLRVAARRLRSGLKTFGPLVHPDWARQMRTELRWIAGEMGPARDAEVMMARLDEHAQQLEDRDALLVRSVIDPVLRRRMASAQERALTALRSERYLLLRQNLVLAANSPQLRKSAQKSARRNLPPLVLKANKNLRRQVNALTLEGPARDWHQARIAAKQARYTAAALELVFDQEASAIEKALSLVTDVLGDHQDACVAQEVIRELAHLPEVDGPTGFAFGLLHEFEFETEIHDRVQFKKIWPDVNKVLRGTTLR